MSTLCCRLSIVFALLSSTAFAQFVVPGDIVVTEFMADPAAVTDASGEWFEIVNVSLTTIDINGWHLKDNGTNDHTITHGGPLEILPGQLFLLANNGNTATNGGITPDYVYYGFNLGNISDEIIITNASGTVIDSVVYSGPYPGKSWSLDPNHWNATDNDNFTYWCLSTSTYGLGDDGTPGNLNDTCTINAVLPVINEKDFSIRANENKLLVHFPSGTNKQEWDISDAAGRIILSGCNSMKENNTVISLDAMSPGIYFFRSAGLRKVLRFFVN